VGKPMDGDEEVECILLKLNELCLFINLDFLKNWENFNKRIIQLDVKNMCNDGGLMNFNNLYLPSYIHQQRSSPFLPMPMPFKNNAPPFLMYQSAKMCEHEKEMEGNRDGIND